MKKTVYMMLTLVAAMLMTACHSNEQNYRQAYEKAMERRQTGVEAETYAKIQAERQRYTEVVDGDSVRLIYMNVNTAIDTTATAMPYNIVVASFTQRINAKSYCDRLREECKLPGSYILFGGNDKKYYVVAGGFNDKVEAVRFMRTLDQRLCIKMLEPIPWILRKI